MIRGRNSNMSWQGALLGACLLVLPLAAWADTSAEYLAEAQAYLKKGELAAAVIQLKNAIKQDPKNKLARQTLGEVYLLGGDGVGAEKELERARRLGVGMDRLAGSLGRAYLMQGKADEALEKIQLEEDYPPALKVDILVVHANAYLMKKQMEAAEKNFREALALDSEAVDALLGLGRVAAMRQQWDKAEELVGKALSLQPKRSEGWAIKGEIARQRGDLAAADAHFDKALSLQPMNPAALLGSAGVNLALGHAEKANKAIDQVLKRSPSHPMANYLRAVGLFRSGDLDAAAEALRVVLQNVPDHLASLQMMGAIDFAKGRNEQAVQALTRVVSAQPDNVAALKLLATTQLKLGQAGDAIETLRQARVGEDAQFLALLGTAYLRNGQNAEGIEYLERAAELDPQAAGVRTQLALGHLASGETSEAIKELETAVDLGKNVFQADLMLTLVHLRNRDFEPALKQAKAFADKNPDSPLPHNLAGAAYLGLGKTTEARSEFNKALKKDARFLPAQMNLGRLAEQQGRLDEAKQSYQTILKLQPDHLGALMSMARLASRQGRDKEALKYLQRAWEGSDGAIQPGLALVQYYNRHKQPLRAVSIAREMKTRNPDDPRVLNALGLSLMGSKDYHAALAAFEALQRVRPESPQPQYLLGMAREALKQGETARRHYEKALAIREDHLPTQLALARLEMGQKNTKAALRIARRIQQQRAGDAVGYRLEGDILMRDGKPAAAARAYDKGLKKVESPRLLLGLYAAQKQTGKKGAHKLLAGWLDTHPDDVAVRAAYAGALQEAGDLNAAVAEYQKLLRKRPDDVVVLNNLAWATQQLGRGNAIEYAEKAYRLAPENPAVIDTLGWLLVSQGEVGRGLPLLEEAVSKAPQLAEIHYHLGVALFRAGQKAKARAALERALELEGDFAGADEARKLLKKI